VTFRNSFIS